MEILSYNANRDSHNVLHRKQLFSLPVKYFEKNSAMKSEM